jgi:hypothetical protein
MKVFNKGKIMGSQLNVYVGVYLKVEAKKIPAESPYVCPEHSSKKFWEAGFCQKCGRALVPTEPRLKMPHLWDLLPDNDGEFVQADMEDGEALVFLSNGIYSAPDHVYMNESDEIELTPIMMEYHLKNFRNSHKESIEKLRAVTTKLTIKFGAIQYYL